MLKINSGLLNNKKINAVFSKNLRPTKNRIRNSIFNILIHGFNLNFSESFFLDAFAGSGAFGMEAISLGGKFVTFVEIDKKNSFFIKNNLQKNHKERNYKVINSDVFKIKFEEKFDVVFLDPPYFENLIPIMIQKLFNDNVIHDESIIITESHKNEHLNYSLNEIIDGRKINKIIEKNYGNIKILFYKK